MKDVEYEKNKYIFIFIERFRELSCNCLQTLATDLGYILYLLVVF